MRSSRVILYAIFVGGCGNTNAKIFLEKYNPEDYPDVYVMAANTEKDLLETLFKRETSPQISNWLDRKQLVVQDLGPMLTGGFGAGGKEWVGRCAAIESIGEIEKFLNSGVDGLDQKTKKLAFIVGGSGKGTAQGAMPVIAEKCQQMGILTSSVVTVPFQWEGTRVKKGRKMVEELTTYVPTQAFENDQLLSDEKIKTRSVEEAWAAINKYAVQQPLEAYVKITQRIATVISSDWADLEDFFRQGNEMVSGKVTVTSSSDMKEIAENLLACKYQRQDVLTKAEAAYSLVNCEWSLGKISEFHAAIQNRLQELTNRKPEDLIVHVKAFKPEQGEDQYVALLVTGGRRSSLVDESGMVGEEVEMKSKINPSVSNTVVVDKPPVSIPMLQMDRVKIPIRRSAVALQAEEIEADVEKVGSYLKVVSGEISDFQEAEKIRISTGNTLGMNIYFPREIIWKLEEKKAKDLDQSRSRLQGPRFSLAGGR